MFDRRRVTIRLFLLANNTTDLLHAHEVRLDHIRINNGGYVLTLRVAAGCLLFSVFVCLLPWFCCLLPFFRFSDPASSCVGRNYFLRLDFVLQCAYLLSISAPGSRILVLP